MQRQAVSSSNIASVGYATAEQTLEVEFHHGAVYQYFSVPAAVHQALVTAPSVGSYHARFIKNVYAVTRVV